MIPMNSIPDTALKAAFLSVLTIVGTASAQSVFSNGQSRTNVANLSAPTEEGVEAVADEVLIVFKDNAGQANIADALNRIGGKIKETKRNPNAGANHFPDFHKVSTRLPVMQAIRALDNHSAVEIAEPNFIYRTQNVKPDAVVDDFYYADDSAHATQFRLWGMEGDPNTGFITSITWPYNSTFGSQADEAWHLEAGWPVVDPPRKAAVVGIIDEGVCFRHPDLIHNAWFNPNETGEILDGNGQVIGDKATNGVDDDDDGSESPAELATHKIDDVNGWDFFNNDNSVYDDVTNQPDGDAHGTHVAGIIGAEAGNGIGVAGVAGIPGTVQMISGKFLGPNGGDTADAIDAINYFIHLKHFHGVNIRALNNSWGGGGYSSLLHAAIIDAANEGILFVAAAGNGNFLGVGQDNDRTPVYPSSYDTTQIVTINGQVHEAGYDSVISVAAIDQNGARASFSNYGASSVDIGAPGVSILSVYPWDVDSSSSKPDPSALTLMDDANAREWCYQPLSGTSMATPHVTGAAALYAYLYPNASAAAIKRSILKTALPTASLNGKCVANGRLNLAGITEAPLEPATKPTSFKVGPWINNGSIVKKAAQVTWNNSAAETAYELQRSTSSSFNKALSTTTIPANQTFYNDSGLNNNTTYYYRMRAVTTVPNGNSVYTATVSFRPQ